MADILITPRNVGLKSGYYYARYQRRLIGDIMQIDHVDFPEKKAKGETVTVKAWGICHCDPLLHCESWMVFIRHDTGAKYRVPSTGIVSIPRNQTELFMMPSFKMPDHDVIMTIEPWEADPWPNPDDRGTPKDITIKLWEYTYAEFVSFDGDRGPFAPGTTGKIADCVVENTGNKRGVVKGKCYDEDGVEVDSWSAILDPGSSSRGGFAARLPDEEGSYTYTAVCYGEDQTQEEGDQRAWTLKIEEGAEPPPPPPPPPKADWRDPLDTFIRKMEEVRPKCPIATIESSWYNFTEKTIEVTPAIRILPPE